MNNCLNSDIVVVDFENKEDNITKRKLIRVYNDMVIVDGYLYNKSGEI